MSPGFPLPPWGLAAPFALALPRPSDPLSPRGLGTAARDVQTQLSAGAIDSRIAFGQSRAAARGGGGRRTGGTGEWRHHAEAGTHTHTHTRWGPYRGGGVRVWVGGGTRGRMSGVGSGQKPPPGLFCKGRGQGGKRRERGRAIPIEGRG